FTRNHRTSWSGWTKRRQGWSLTLKNRPHLKAHARIQPK
ncbi:unnamed protein product, partial [Tetraodon nigroviridis]